MHNSILRRAHLAVGLIPLLALIWWMGGLSTLAQGPAPEATPASATPAAIAPRLAQDLSKSSGPISFLVILKEQPDAGGYLARTGLRNAERTARGAALYRYLTDFASSSQAPLLAWLDSQGVSYRAFYLVNAIEVYGDAALARSLQKRAEVDRLAANPRVKLSLVDETPMPAQSKNADGATPDPPYGIRYANAPAVWAQGFQGQGIVVASQDTGVDWTHPALHDQYRGWDAAAQTVTHPYNWYDYWGTANRGNCDPNPQVPCDDHGHGTHTVGTMLGDDPRTGLIAGMAPQAQWIGCRNMNGGDGTPASYIGCFEFFLAPFPQGGNPRKDGDSSKAPHIINNSWYCPPSEGCDYASLRQVVQTVRAAGQLIVVSAGNDGPGCSTVRYPITAYPEVFSVGAHNGAGGIAGFSSRGPVTVDGSGRMKPQITAAGDGVLSTTPGGNYGNNSGTSMAAPHVAGAAALLWSAVPQLIGQLEATEQILMLSATPVLHNGCGEGDTPVSPNYTYGHGRLNAAAAITLAAAQYPGAITATVTSTVGPLEGITVTLTNQATGAVENVPTDSNGQAVFASLYLGNYGLVTASEAISASASLILRAGENWDVQLSLTQDYYLPHLLRPTEGSDPETEVATRKR